MDTKYFSLPAILFILCFSLFSLLIVTNLEAARREVEIIKLSHRPVMEIVPHIEQLLSPTGRLSADSIGNTLIAVDDQEHLKIIIEVVRKLDRVMPRVAVTLRYHELGKGERRLASGQLLPKTSLPLSTRKSRTSKQLMVRSSLGYPAYLAVGQNVLFDRFWIALSREYGLVVEHEVEEQRIGTGLEVTATLLGEQVELSLLPRISFMEGETIFFREAAITTTVIPGQWTGVGTMSDKQYQVLRGLLLGTSHHSTTNIAMEVLVRLE